MQRRKVPFGVIPAKSALMTHSEPDRRVSVPLVDARSAVGPRCRRPAYAACRTVEFQPVGIVGCKILVVPHVEVAAFHTQLLLWRWEA